MRPPTPLRPAHRLHPGAALLAATALLAALPALIGPAPARAAATADVRTVTACPARPGAARCFAQRLAGPPAAVAARVAAATGRAVRAVRAGAGPAAAGYTPAELRSAYGIVATGTTRTVAIVDAFDSPTVESDLAQYRAAFGMPACTTDNGCFTKVNQDGNTSPLPAADPGWADEITLDVEMVSAMCPTCHILLVEADSASTLYLPQAAQWAASQHPAAVSMSWGAPEGAVSPGLDDQYFALARQGVPFVAASGDYGYGAQWPAADPYVTAVGGTALRVADDARGWSETVWNSGAGSATQSGCATDQPAAPWQPAAATAACAGRAENDVAMVADPNTGVAVYQTIDGTGSWVVYGGTSAATPMVAALYAMAGPTDPTASPAGYPYAQGAGHFHDVTSGTDGSCDPALLCTAAPGWDGPSGLGSPDGLGGFAAPVAAPPAPSGTVTVHDPGPQRAWLGSAVGIDASATDTAALPLSYTATGLPAGTAIGADGRITGTPVRTGSYPVEVSATDSAGATGRTGFLLTVRRHRLVTALAPRFTGSYRVGSTVRLDYGGWRVDRAAGAPAHRVAVRVQWYAGGTAIPGATGIRYALRPGVRGRRLSVRLSASKASYLGWDHVVVHPGTVAAKPRLVTARAPWLSGPYRAGGTLTLHFGGWRVDRAGGARAAGVRTRYQWYAAGVAVPGATAARFRIRARERHERISVRLTGSRPATVGYAHTVVHPRRVR